MTYFNSLQVAKPLNQFGELRTSQRTPIIELKSAVPDVSDIRNVSDITGSATVATANSEYQLDTTAATGDKIDFKSAERGRYLPGFGVDIGLGIRYASGGISFAGTAQAEWGYRNGEDGFVFGEDATGIFVRRYRNGSVAETVYQSSWNNDTFGAGSLNPSGISLDLTNGYIFDVDFTWYGYGLIIFNIITANSLTGLAPQQPFTAHVMQVQGSTSIEQPNCPIFVSLDNGDDATARQLFVGGRNFSIAGPYNPVLRATGDRRSGVSAGTGSWVPMISFRRKGPSKFLAQSVKILNAEILADADVWVAFFHNATLTGESFSTPTDATAAETVLDSDTSATAISGGIQIGGVHLISGANNRSLTQAIRDITYDLVEELPLTLAVRGVSATADVAAALNMTEEW